jgi:hypothetical protein
MRGTSEAKMSEKTSRRGPKPAPPETHYQRWNVTLPPELSDKLFLLMDGDENKSELLTRLLETHPVVAALSIRR